MMLFQSSMQTGQCVSHKTSKNPTLKKKTILKPLKNSLINLCSNASFSTFYFETIVMIGWYAGLAWGGGNFLHSGWNRAVFCFCAEHRVDNRE